MKIFVFIFLLCLSRDKEHDRQKQNKVLLKLTICLKDCPKISSFQRLYLLLLKNERIKFNHNKK